jgi:hypothetical protein
MSSHRHQPHADASNTVQKDLTVVLLVWRLKSFHRRNSSRPISRFVDHAIAPIRNLAPDQNVVALDRQIAPRNARATTGLDRSWQRIV